jgi:hypothetical protein
MFMWYMEAFGGSAFNLANSSVASFSRCADILETHWNISTESSRVSFDPSVAVVGGVVVASLGGVVDSGGVVFNSKISAFCSQKRCYFVRRCV